MLIALPAFEQETHGPSHPCREGHFATSPFGESVLAPSMGESYIDCHEGPGSGRKGCCRQKAVLHISGEPANEY
jgi:hypothetical protein